MKHIIAVFAIGALALFPILTNAAEYRIASRSGAIEGGAFSENAYVVGGNVIVAEDASADLVVAGGEVMTSGRVTEDLLVGGGDISVDSEVGGDLRIAGGDITVGGTVLGEASMAGGQVRVLSSAVLGSGLDVAAGTVLIGGTVKGNARLHGGEVEITGRINGNVDVRVSEKLVLGEDAVIEGKLIYRAPKEISVPAGAKIGGIEYAGPSPMSSGPDDVPWAGKFALGAWWFMKVVAEIVVGLALFFLLRRTMGELVSVGASSFAREALRGFVLLVTVPIAALLLFFTGVGAFLGIVVLMLYVFSLLLSIVMGGAIAGTVTAMALGKGTAHTFNWQTVVGGIVLLNIVGAVPLVGWIVCFAFFLAGIGVLGYGMKELHRHGRS